MRGTTKCQTVLLSIIIISYYFAVTSESCGFTVCIQHDRADRTRTQLNKRATPYIIISILYYRVGTQTPADPTENVCKAILKHRFFFSTIKIVDCNTHTYGCTIINTRWGPMQIER